MIGRAAAQLTTRVHRGHAIQREDAGLPYTAAPRLQAIGAAQPAAEAGEDGALRVDLLAGCGVVDAGGLVHHVEPVRPALERKSAPLTGRGQDIEDVGDVRPRPSRPSRRRARPRRRGSPSATRASWAPRLPWMSTNARSGIARAVGRRAAASRCPPSRPRAARPGRQAVAGAERVARVGALGHRRGRQSRDRRGGEVLQRVHGEVAAAGRGWRCAAPPRTPPTCRAWSASRARRRPRCGCAPARPRGRARATGR